MDGATQTRTNDRIELPVGAIDCDIHPPAPAIADITCHMDDYWHDTIVARGIMHLDSIAYPHGAPLTSRPDWRDAAGGLTNDPVRMRHDALDQWGIGTAILNSLYGVHLLHDPHMASAFARATNDWLAEAWLDKDKALRASIVIPIQDTAAAVAEIERRASDPRFVQVLFPVAAETPYGRAQYWPIYEAAVRHGLPIGIHSGSSYRHPVTSLGWPTHYVEDYVAQAQAFQAQLASLVSDGAFAKFPGLKVVLIELGVAWLPAFLWRFSKFWRGLRPEVPWVDRSPLEIVRDQVRLTMQPFDAPNDATTVGKVIDQIGSDAMLLFASDYPHWQFDGDRLVPDGVDATLLRKMAIENPRETYPRLKETQP